MKKLFIIMFCMVLLVGSVSALITKDFQVDEEKSRDSTTDYGTITLKDRYWLDVFGWFEETVKEITLKENTETCGEECYAIKEITLYKKGTLVDEVKFETILEDGSRVIQPIREFKFYIQTEVNEIEVDDFEYQCSGTGTFLKNGTEEMSCESVKVGSHIQLTPEWVEYNYEELEAGTYTIKLEGKKKPSRKVDWIVKSQGVWLNEWAVWGGFLPYGNEDKLVYYRLNEGTGTTVIDEIGNHNGVYSSSPTWLAHSSPLEGFNNYTNVSGTTNGAITSFKPTQVNFNEFSLEFRIRTNTQTAPVYVIGAGATGVDLSQRGFAITKPSNNLRVIASNTGSFFLNDFDFGCASIEDNNFHHVVLVKNSSHHWVMWQDGVKCSNTGSGDIGGAAGQNFTIHNRQSLSVGLIGALDQVIWWNKTLTSSEIIELNNSLVDSPAGSVTLNSPADNSISTSAEVNFNATAIAPSGATLSNMSLWLNGVLNESKIDLLNPILYVEEEGLTLSSSDSQTLEYATRINVSEKTKLVNVTRYHGVTANRCVLQYDNQTSIKSGTFVGENCEINEDLEVGTIYRVLIGSSGSSYTRFFQGSPAFPRVGTNGLVTYISGTDSSGNPQTTNWMNLGNLTVQKYSGATSITEVFTQTIPSGATLWNVQACDNDGDCAFAQNNFTITLDSDAPEIEIHRPLTLEDYGAFGQSQILNFTATDTNLDTCWFNYDNTNTTISCSSGVSSNTTFTLTNQKNLTVFANDTAGNLDSEFISWDYKVFENSRTFNSSVFETSSQTYSLNLTTNSSLTAVKLNFNNSLTDLSNQGSGIWSLTRDMPTDIGNFTFDYQFTYASGTFNSYNSNQEVKPIIFGLTNGTLTTSYINFTFKDEQSLATINGTIPTSNFIYYLGSGTTNKTLNYINTTANPSYAFAFSPSSETLKVIPTIQYSNTGYQQRIFVSDTLTLTNSTTNQVLYLLSDLDGVFSTYRVLSSSGQLLSGVIVNATRVIDTETVLVGSGTTDDLGEVTMWLNPNFVHTITFFKEGFPIDIRSITPQGGSRDIILGQEEQPLIVVDDFTRGITQSILPIDQYLTNGTSYNFTYQIGTTFWALDEFGFNLTYLNGTLIGSQSSINQGGGTLVFEGNTLDSRRVTMNYYYIINGTQINGQKYWIVNTASGYGLTNFFEVTGTYINSDVYGFLGISGDGNFSKAFLSLMILIIVAGVLSFRYGVASEPMIIGVLFGLVLLLNSVNLLPDPILPMRISFGDFLALIIGLLGVVFIIKEEMR